jgi:AcrR family transcriptional regulator
MTAGNDKRKHMMRVVEKLASDRRFHEITLDEIAEAAKVGKGTIYHYFKDKDDLFFQVATNGFDELCELLKQKVGNDSVFSERLSSACKEISRFFDGRRQLLQIMQSQAGRVCWHGGRIRQQWLGKRKMLINAVAEIISAGIKQGAIRTDVPAEVLASFLLGILRTRARDLYGTSESERSYKLLVDLFLNGASVTVDKRTLRRTASKYVKL